MCFMAIRRNYILLILLTVLLFFCVILLFLNTLVKWTPSWNPTVPKTCKLRNEQQLMGKSIWSWATAILGHNDSKLGTSNQKIQYETTVIVKRQTDSLEITTKDFHGLHCPANSHKETALKNLFNYWMALKSYYDLSGFLCGPHFSGLYGAL